MRRTRIKICGVRDPQTARVAAAAGADAIGLNFVEGSPRQVSINQAQQIVGALPGFIEPVPVFVDADPVQIRDTASRLGISTVQLHGDETPQDAAALAPLRVIKALPFDTDRLLDRIETWRRNCNNLVGLLIDTPPPTSNPDPAHRGGSGTSFDWRALAASLPADPPATSSVGIILAGGLTPANVGQAIGAVRPFAVDVSSGIESSRGVKDPGLIERFCEAVRQVDAGC